MGLTGTLLISTNIILWLFVILVTGQLPEVFCPQHPKPVGLPDELPQELVKGLQQLELQFEATIKQNNLVGVSAAVVYDQRQLWSKGFGNLDRNNPSRGPVTPDTLFRIGSLTKVFTDLLLLQLRDANIVSLDDTVQKYWPSFSIPSEFSKNSRGISFRGLATQLSGIFSGSPCSYLEDCNITTEEAFRRMSTMESVLPNDLQPHYSDVAFAILGRALERPAKQKWEEMLLSKVLKPLGMSSTGWDYSTAEVKMRLATGYFGKFALPYGLATKDLGWARPTGQLYSSVNDLSKLLSFFFTYDSKNKNNVLLGSSTREMLLPTFVNDDVATGFGFPFERYFTGALSKNGSKYWVVMKGGAFPGYSTAIAMIPELKLGFIAQNNGNSAVELNTLFADSFLPLFEKILFDLAPLPPNPGNLSAFVGVYRSVESFFLGSYNITLDETKWKNTTINQLSLSHSEFGDVYLEWIKANIFRIRYDITGPGPCLSTQMGMNNEFVVFQTSPKNGEVVSLMLPSTDPFYGVVFHKHNPQISKLL
jgi:CubicO group peptidase (beta-lactamase class C family)